MPLVLITGMPGSGKSTRASQIENYFKNECNKVVLVVSDNNVLKTRKIDKNLLVFDAQKEKEIRGILKSDALRVLGRDNIVILDASNYIKGFRYELYCATKNSKTTQVVVECIARKEESWQWNFVRPDEDKYTKDAFDALFLRYEAPDSRNRWDSPLVSLQTSAEINGPELFKMLFEKKPPPPNMSTQSAPLAAPNFLYELDKTTQEVVNGILQAQKMGLEGADVKINNFEDCTLEYLPGDLTPAQLARYRRQFLNYTKMHPPSNQDVTDKAAYLFVQFLNTILNNSSS